MSSNTGKIALIGMMGSGKSAVSKSLSQKTGIPAFETDEIFEKKFQIKIKDFFKKFGEKEFRKLEAEILKEITEKNDNFILSTGGGMILAPENRKILFQGKITTIYLEASAETIFQRIKGDTARPLLLAEKPEDKIREILNSRVELYELAKIKITTDTKLITEITEEIYGRIWKKF